MAVFSTIPHITSTAKAASSLQPFHYIVVLWATVIGYTVFGDPPDLWTVPGAAVIASSGLYAFHLETQAET